MEDKKIITLWHGGRNLNKYDLDFRPAKQGRWEYGPGLYLTTHYETARKYAKGGGKTYLISLEEGNDIESSLLSLSEVSYFANANVVKSKQKDFLEDIYDNVRRMGTDTNVHASVFLNLIINSDLVKGQKVSELNNFLIANKIDYSIVNRFSGRDETVLALFNLSKITDIKPIPANEVGLDRFELPAPVPNKKKSVFTI